MKKKQLLKHQNAVLTSKQETKNGKENLGKTYVRKADVRVFSQNFLVT